MEIGMREILIVLGCLIMTVLFVDAYRRVRDHRRSQFGFRVHDEPTLSQQRSLEGFDDDELADDQLTPVRPLAQRNSSIRHNQVNRAHESSQTPQQIRVRISTPKTADGLNNTPSAAPHERATRAKPAALQAFSEEETILETKVQTGIPKSKMKEDLFADLQGQKSAGPIKALLQPALATAPESGDFYSSRRNSQAAKTARKQQVQKQQVDKQQAPSVQPQEPPQDVIVMHVAAGADDVFNGEVLVQHLLSLNLRHGDMKIFHRFERPEQHEGLLFSMANMVKPGLFELDHMSAFETPGVTFFLKLPCLGGGLYSFDLMVDTARKLAKIMDGELRDETQSIMTAQTVEHFRQRVMEFERKQRMMQKTRQIRERSKLFD